MTNKRKVYNQLGTKPKRVAVIAKATGLTPERTLAFLKQLHKEGHADYRQGSAGTGWIKGTGVPPKAGGGGASPPVTPPPPAPKPSWTLPSPLILSGVYGDTGHALDPATGKPREGVGTIGQILVPGVCPLWECHPVNGTGRGLLGQIEGFDQLQMALDLITEHKQPGDHLAIVGTGNVKAQLMLDHGVNVYFIELNGQAGMEPYANAGAMKWAAQQDGWPHVYVSYGCYVPLGLQDYAAYHPAIYNANGEIIRYAELPQGIEDYFACFSGQGMTDTNSWPALAAA